MKITKDITKAMELMHGMTAEECFYVVRMTTMSKFTSSIDILEKLANLATETMTVHATILKEMNSKTLSAVYELLGVNMHVGPPVGKKKLEIWENLWLYKDAIISLADVKHLSGWGLDFIKQRVLPEYDNIINSIKYTDTHQEFIDALTKLKNNYGEK